MILDTFTKYYATGQSNMLRYSLRNIDVRKYFVCTPTHNDVTMFTIILLMRVGWLQNNRYICKCIVFLFVLNYTLICYCIGYCSHRRRTNSWLGRLGCIRDGNSRRKVVAIHGNGRCTATTGER